MSLMSHMGQLLGPRSVCEIVITLYENDKINYQFEGMTGPVAPGVAYRLLKTVADEVAKHIQPEIQKIVVPTVPQETSQSE